VRQPVIRPPVFGQGVRGIERKETGKLSATAAGRAEDAPGRRAVGDDARTDVPTRAAVGG
jgi:hypothetical protein